MVTSLFISKGSDTDKTVNTLTEDMFIFPEFNSNGTQHPHSIKTVTAYRVTTLEKERLASLSPYKLW